MTRRALIHERRSRSRSGDDIGYGDRLARVSGQASERASGGTEMTQVRVGDDRRL